MEYKILIYKNEKILCEKILKKVNGNKYIYKWSGVEGGGYSFAIKNEENEVKGVTYNHTAPFATDFKAFVDKNETPKVITGFQSGVDILIVYDNIEDKLILKKTKFFDMKLDISQFSLDKASKIEICGDFNNWIPEEEPIKIVSNTLYNVKLDVKEGIYEYKYIIDDKWYPENENLKIVIGENGALFPKGEIGTGKFSFAALDKDVNLKAIVHNYKNLNYFNKLSNREYEFKIRTQMNDVERVYINIKLWKENSYEMIYELERNSDKLKGFDYFSRIIDFGKKDVDKISYYFVLEDGSKKVYFDGKNITTKIPKRIYVDTKIGDIQFFSVPNWSKEVVWYNIFPERFYNGNYYNDPIFNEFGPENYIINELHETNFVEKYKWNKNENTKGKFDKNKWTSDFSERVNWEKEGEKNINYSLKYARMYGGDIEGIKKKIPYLKELGINAVWLNPVFFSYQNHKYGANDFRHISPDFGTIRTSGSKHNVYIDSKNSYGNKSYVEVLGKNSVNNSELKLLEMELKGENKYKNGYGETEDPKTWVWTESDLLMVDLIKELHRNEIRVIFDGVFNHSSNRHWSFNIVMAEGEKSKYKNWYKFNDFSKHIPVEDYMTDEEVYETLRLNKLNVKYNGWAGFETLPEFNTFNEEYKDYIFNITRKWMYGPDGKTSKNWMEDDGIDGWRLDVPNCLENQNFWLEWREVVKKTKDDAYITAELWGNASGDINNGNKFDTVMNYEWLKTVIGFFINRENIGGDTYKLTPEDFFNELREKRTWYPFQALQASQNLNGSHDTDRLYSRIVNDKVGRNLEEGKQIEKGYNGIRPDLASNYHPNTSINWIESEIKPKDILKLISIFQMTYIGAPMLYYGDEVGMWGATDPYCRKPMLWDEFMYDEEKNPSIVNRGEIYSQEIDIDLLEWYKKLIKIRRENKVLVYGRFNELLADNERDIIAYERTNEGKSIIVVINNSFEERENIEIQSEYKNEKYIDLISGNMVKTNVRGKLKIILKGKQGMILKRWKKQ